jgi:hypothetical protein
MKWWSKKNKLFILIFIILLGAFLRLYRFETFTSWMSDDSARDVLVAKHIVLGEVENIRPFAAHGLNLINNSPFYYYLVSAFWLIGRSPIFIGVMLAILGICCIYCSYRCGQLLVNDNFGLILAFFNSISFVLIRFSRSIYQAYLMPVWFWLFLLALLKSIKNKSFRWLLLSEIVFFVGLHLHYSVFLLIPFGLFWISYSYLNLKKEQRKPFNSVVFLGSMVVLTWWWLEWTYVYKIGDQIEFLRSTLTSGLPNYWFNLKENNKVIVKALIPFLENNSGWFMALLISGNFLAGLTNLIKRPKKISSGLIICLGLNYLVLGFYGNRWKTDWVFASIYPVVIFFLGYLIYRIFELKFGKILGLTLLTVGAISLGWNDKMYFKFHSNEYQEAKKIASVILKDSQLQGVDNLNLRVWHRANVDYVPWDWFSSSIWYFLEKETGQELVNNVSLEVNLTNILPINPQPQFNYLVCSDFNKGESFNKCQDKFSQNFKEAVVDKIYENQSNDLNYAIYRFKNKY